LLDQRTRRKMAIGSVDEAETNRRVKHFERSFRRQSRPSQEKKIREGSQEHIAAAVSEVVSSSSAGEQSEASTGSDAEFSIPKKKKLSLDDGGASSSQMRVKLPNFAQAIARARVSKRQAARLASSLLENLGMVSPENTDSVIDPSKVQREQKTFQKGTLKRAAEALQGRKIKSIYFDGRKGETLSVQRKGETSRRIATEGRARRAG